ncbi:disease resistance family protein / LRR family protein [Prunus dulcis]|uniref:Disease resistance family protein / LRR family protein n=1 Tax=Prunus dulcis TaxID=3755 RepID=A0A4Y1R246_PRUDU|nr:disease resistance family protein / LRR family protein [Prunus dulcis]
MIATNHTDMMKEEDFSPYPAVVSNEDFDVCMQEKTSLSSIAAPAETQGQSQSNLSKKSLPLTCVDPPQLGTMRAVLPLIRFLTIATITVSIGLCNGNMAGPCNEGEKQALLTFKQHLKDPANRLSSWVGEEDSNCCNWTGVVCDNLTGHVLELHLGNSNSLLNSNTSLGGKVSRSLLSLKHLNYLDLSNNDFQGIQIPKFFGSLISLRYLNLSKAGFEGIIPHQLGNLTSLRYLCLGDYKLKVENLQWVSGLSHLEHLDMSSADLSKASDWLQVTNMLPSLKELYLFGCGLYHIPSLPLINFNSLAILDLSANVFTSLMPKWVFSLRNLVSLSLNNCGFQGPIPSNPQNITSLREIDFSWNNLSLPIPAWLFNHKDLTSLNLGYNYLGGTIPDGIANMTGLKVLNLETNLFTSTIPKWLYSFSNLESLILSGNHLQGEILSSIGNLTSIVTLHLNDNQFEGRIPKSLVKLCKLVDLDLSMNNFTVGKASEIIESLSSVCPSDRMKSLSLRYCNLSGHLTEKIRDFKNLSYLDLSGNSISGPIPVSLGNLSFLVNLDISDNQFNGTLPETIGQLKMLTNLDISYNSLEGVVSEVHFTYLSRLEEFSAKGNSMTLNTSRSWLPPFQLQHLYLDSWHLGPELPNWLQGQALLWTLSLPNTGVSVYLNISHNQLCGEVQDMVVGPSVVIDLGSNQFNGSLPLVSSTVHMLDLSNSSFSGSVSRFFCHNMHEPKQLYLLHLGKNLLTGKIPECWMNWQNLAVVNFEGNHLTGNIPRSMGYLLNLKSLQLRNNHLSGELPSSLQNCTKLSVVDLGGNKFVGSLPLWIGSLSDLLVLNFRSNKFQGSIPSELCNLINLQILDLADNNISGTIPRCFHKFSAMATLSKSNSRIFCCTTFILMGDIPEELTSLLRLRTLNLSENLLTGRIPSNIGNMTRVESLDFSMNQLDGEIPQSVTSLTFLSHLNLSHNT